MYRENALPDPLKEVQIILDRVTVDNARARELLALIPRRKRSFWRKLVLGYKAFWREMRDE